MTLVRFLIEAGADVDGPSGARFTALVEAGKGGQVAVVRELVSRGASVGTPDGFGVGPLIGAVRSGKFEVIRELLQSGADLRRDPLGNDPLTDALVLRRPREVMEALLAGGAPLDGGSLGGFSPLHGAVICGSVQAEEVLQLLLERGADPNAVDGFGATPLWHAAWFGREEAAVALVRAGADVNREDAAGVTPLSVARGAVRNVLLRCGGRI